MTEDTATRRGWVSAASDRLRHASLADIAGMVGFAYLGALAAYGLAARH